MPWERCNYLMFTRRRAAGGAQRDAIRLVGLTRRYCPGESV